MLEWITAPKKQSVLEVKLLPGDPAREDTLIHIPYSKLIDLTLADRSSAGAVILRFRDLSLALLARSFLSV